MSGGGTRPTTDPRYVGGIEAGPKGVAGGSVRGRFGLSPLWADVVVAVAVFPLSVVNVATQDGVEISEIAIAGFVMLDDGILFAIDRLVESALQRGFLNKEIVDKELTAHIDGNNIREIIQIRHRHRVSRNCTIIRRPLLRQLDTIIKGFARTA